MMTEGETDNNSDAEEELQEEDESDVDMDEVVDDESKVSETTEKEDKGEQSKENKNEDEESLSADEEQNCTMQKLLYQNDLLLFRLEKAEMNEEVLWKEMSLLRNTTKNDTNQEVTSL